LFKEALLPQRRFSVDKCDDMLRTNRKKLIQQSVIGSICQPYINQKNPYLVDIKGRPRVLPGTGGITYNVSVGDSAFYFEGDHVEPGVTVSEKNIDNKASAKGGLTILACIGNSAEVVSGRKKGAKGIVTGKHGGVEHVMVDFAPSVTEKLVIGDKIQIRALGQGLKLDNFPELEIMNVDPGLFNRLRIKINSKQIIVPVAHVIPAALLGSGTGARHSYSGDCDIQVSDEAAVRKHSLDKLRIGDVVAVNDADCRYGRSVATGSCSVGVVVHASSIVSGHGPGVTFIMAAGGRMIVPKVSPEANIAGHLKIGRKRVKRRSKSRKR